MKNVGVYQKWTFAYVMFSVFSISLQRDITRGLKECGGLWAPKTLYTKIQPKDMKKPPKLYSNGVIVIIGGTYILSPR